MPAPTSTAIVSATKDSEPCRASRPRTTAAGPRPRPDPCGHPGGGPADDHLVHAVGARAHDPAQAGGAELQIGAEPVPQVGRGGAVGPLLAGPVDQLDQLPGARRRGVVGRPGRGPGQQVGEGLGLDRVHGAQPSSRCTSWANESPGRAPVWPMTAAAAMEPSRPQESRSMPWV